MVKKNCFSFLSLLWALNLFWAMPIDESVHFRIINDGQIKILFVIESVFNLIFLIWIYFYSSSFIEFIFGSQERLTSLVFDLLYLWASWILIVTMTMLFLIVPFKNAATNIAGFPFARQCVYYWLLLSELFLGFYLFLTDNQSSNSGFCSLALIFMAVCRWMVIRKKSHWFGTVVLRSGIENKRKWVEMKNFDSINWNTWSCRNNAIFK